MTFDTQKVNFNGGMISLVPFTEATSSGANTPPEVHLSEEERTLNSLARERGGRPLYLLYSQSMICLRDHRVERICREVKALWNQTMPQKLLLPDDLIPDRLQALQALILETNLLKIGEVWDKGCTCFGCCIDLPRVEKWIQEDPEKLRIKLQKDDFRKKWLDQCTFIPPEVVPLIGDAQWVAIGEHALFPQLNKKRWQPKVCLFLQVMALKKDQIPPAKLENWLSRVVDAYQHCESEQQRFEYEAVIEPIVQLALQNLIGPLDAVMISFMQGRPYKRSCILKLAVKITDSLLEKFVKECVALFMSRKKKSSEKSKIYLELIKWAGSQRILPESFKEICDDFSVIPDKYYSIFIPHLPTVPTKILERLFLSSIAKDDADLFTAAIQQHEKISDRTYQRAFLGVKKNGQFLSQLLVHKSKLDNGDLGESLYLCTVAHGFDCVFELLKHSTEIPPAAFVKSLIYVSIEYMHEPIRKALSPHVKATKPDIILSVLQPLTADKRLKFLNCLESISYPHLSAFEKISQEWQEEWKKEHEELIRLQRARSERTPSPSFGNSTVTY